MSLGLSAADERRFDAALRTHRTIRVQLDVLDLDQVNLATVEENLLAGDVTVDGSADVTRSLSVTLWDPEHRLRLDSDAPAAGALFADRMIRAWYGVRVPDVGWVDVPVFTGPVTKLDRDDATVVVEAQGKESLALRIARDPITVPAGTPKVAAIRQILRERAGETKFDLPDLRESLTDAVTVGREGIPWVAAQRIARGMDRQLFYDGRGRLRLRRLPDGVAWAFDERVITSVPQVSFSDADTVNDVRVVGRQPRGADSPVTATATADRSHPYSPARLARGGRRGYRSVVVTDDTIGTKAEAQALADRLLARSLAQSVDVSYDCVPVPHLDAGDLGATTFGDMSMRNRCWRFGIPLTHEGTMPVGYTRRVSSPLPRRRVNR
jgi:hypothetical protein